MHKDNFVSNNYSTHTIGSINSKCIKDNLAFTLGSFHCHHLHWFHQNITLWLNKIKTTFFLSSSTSFQKSLRMTPQIYKLIFLEKQFFLGNFNIYHLAKFNHPILSFDPSIINTSDWVCCPKWQSLHIAAPQWFYPCSRASYTQKHHGKILQHTIPSPFLSYCLQQHQTCEQSQKPTVTVILCHCHIQKMTVISVTKLLQTTCL